MTREEAKKALEEDLPKVSQFSPKMASAYKVAISALSENKEIKEPTLLESFKDGTGKVTEIWAVKGKLQIRTHGTIHNCNGIFGNDISVKSVNGDISVFSDWDAKMTWAGAIHEPYKAEKGGE